MVVVLGGRKWEGGGRGGDLDRCGIDLERYFVNI